jgi:hypothetical protein
MEEFIMRNGYKFNLSHDTLCHLLPPFIDFLFEAICGSVEALPIQ